MKWIKTEEDVPEDNQIVLCCDTYNNFISLGKYLSYENTFLLMNIEGIEIDSYPTHWMRLPSLPEPQ